jgi:hypothetical protein
MALLCHLSPANCSSVHSSAALIQLFWPPIIALTTAHLVTLSCKFVIINFAFFSLLVKHKVFAASKL